MSLHRLKPGFQAMLRPLARRIADRGGTANQVTVLTTVASVLLGAVLWVAGSSVPALYLLLPPWLLARMALNAVDGLLAREFRQRSRLGAYLNELCDPVCDAALVLPLAALPPFSPAVTVLVVLLASWTELAGVLGPTVGATRRYDGPMGKSDRALVLGALGAWIGVTGSPPAWAAWGMAAVAALVALTLVNRVRAGLAEGRLR